MIDQLKTKWSTVKYSEKAYSRIDATHPIEWYLGYDDLKNKSLLLISETKPPDLKSSKNIQLSIGIREDNKWAFSLNLINNNYEEVFLNLCNDLMESSRTKHSSLGYRFIFNRYSQWIKLMEAAKKDSLTDSEVKGLMGELLVLNTLLDNGVNKLEVINNWMGPEGNDQDFVLENYWIEVKTIGRSTNEIKISSLEQLRDDIEGILTVVNLDSSSPNSKSAVSLSLVFNRVLENLSKDDDAKEAFLSKLLFNGFPDLNAYDEKHYEVGEINNYKVNESFPRLTRRIISGAIINVTYVISKSSIQNWKI